MIAGAPTQIIGPTVAAAIDETSVLLDRIRALAEEPVRGPRASLLARIERTLTDGYAQALALEAERLRLERRIGEVAAALEEGDREGKARELSALARRLSTADGDLSHLRRLLSSLRLRADAVRS